jgi:hypothetical protein
VKGLLVSFDRDKVDKQGILYSIVLTEAEGGLPKEMLGMEGEV